MDEAVAWLLVWLMCVNIGREACRPFAVLIAVCWQVLDGLTPW
jgi:hypothetical protein